MTSSPSAEVVEKTNRILDIVFAHLEKECPHCKEMFKEKLVV
jgi:hypothetical protein